MKDLSPKMQGVYLFNEIMTDIIVTFDMGFLIEFLGLNGDNFMKWWQYSF